MTCVYDLNLWGKYDLFEPGSFDYVKSHKRSKVTNCAGFVEIKYQKEHNLISSGFKVILRTNPGKKYLLVVEAYLNMKSCLRAPLREKKYPNPGPYLKEQSHKEEKGDEIKAFIYCESDNTRLIERKFFFYPGKEGRWEIPFLAKNEHTNVGILFFTGTHDYLLEVTEFLIREM